MALRQARRRDVEKSSYYVWFLGSQESQGLRGRQYVAPVVEELVDKERHVEPNKVTLQVSSKGLKVVQHVPKKSSRGTETVKHFIPDHAITCAVQEPEPDADIVSCVLLIYNPVTRCPVHVHTYRCDSPDTASTLLDQLQVLIGRPENQTRIQEIESRLISRGLLSGGPQQPAHSRSPSPGPGPSEPAGSSDPADPQPGQASTGSGGRVATLYDSLAAELREKIGRSDSGPLLLPPRDYDADPTSSGCRGKANYQEDSSGIGSDDAPSPDHRDQRTSSEEEWELTGHSSAEILLEPSSPWKHGSGWKEGRRSAAGDRSPDTDTDQVTSGHSSSRKVAERRQRSPSGSPQDRFNHARLKFVQMEKGREQTNPPSVVPPRKSDASLDVAGSGPDYEDGGRPLRRRSSIDGAGVRDGGRKLPIPSEDGRRDAPPEGRREAGWKYPVRPADLAKHVDEQRAQVAEPSPVRAGRDGAAGQVHQRKDARGRPHVADIFRQPAEEPAQSRTPGQSRDARLPPDGRLGRSAELKDQSLSRYEAAVPSGRDRLDSARRESEVVPPRELEETEERVSRWVRRAVDETHSASGGSSSGGWPSPAGRGQQRRTGTDASEPSPRPDSSGGLYRLAKSRSSDGLLGRNRERVVSPGPAAEPRRPAADLEQEQRRRASAAIAEEVAQRRGRRRTDEPEPIPQPNPPSYSREVSRRSQASTGGREAEGRGPRSREEVEGRAPRPREEVEHRGPRSREGAEGRGPRSREEMGGRGPRSREETEGRGPRVRQETERREYRELRPADRLPGLDRDNARQFTEDLRLERPRRRAPSLDRRPQQHFPADEPPRRPRSRGYDPPQDGHRASARWSEEQRPRPRGRVEYRYLSPDPEDYRPRSRERDPHRPPTDSPDKRRRAPSRDRHTDHRPVSRGAESDLLPRPRGRDEDFRPASRGREPEPRARSRGMDGEYHPKSRDGGIESSPIPRDGAVDYRHRSRDRLEGYRPKSRDRLDDYRPKPRERLDDYRPKVRDHVDDYRPQSRDRFDDYRNKSRSREDLYRKSPEKHYDQRKVSAGAGHNPRNGPQYGADHHDISRFDYRSAMKAYPR